MGAPILLGGGVFGVSEAHLIAALQGLDYSSGRGVASLSILTEIVAGLRHRGYKVSKPKQGTPEDVRVSCDLGDGRIELLLVSDIKIGRAPQFTFLVFDFSRINRQASQRNVAVEWKRLSAAINDELAERFGAGPVDWLTGSEFGAKSDVGRGL